MADTHLHPSCWRRTLALVLLVGASVACGVATAQAYPVKPIRFVVPYPPGGPLDLMGRLIGQKLTDAWMQPVLVENRAGAGGNIGAEMVAKSAPDGYTLLMGAVATHAINPSLYRKVSFDPFKDFVAVALVAQVPNILVVNPLVPASNVRELIALAKAKPGSLNFGSGSTGSTGHLAGELFNTMAGVRMTHIPYKGGAPAMQDLLGGQVQLMFDNLANSLPQVKAGKLRALAVTTDKRSPFVPDIPTVEESGVPGFDLTTWFGIFVSGGTPRELVTRLNTEVVRILALADVRQRLDEMGAAPIPNNTPENFSAFVRREYDKYAKVVKNSGAKAD